MNDIVEKLLKRDDLAVISASHPTKILQAENELGLMFNDEYLLYTSSFGAALFNGHEWTGVCDSPRIDVVNVTKNERKRNAMIPGDWYVVERTKDGSVIWQSSTGQIYKTDYNAKYSMIAKSLVEYFNQCCK